LEDYLTMESIPDNHTSILVVDDDVGLLSSIKATLVSSGIPEPVLVSDGKGYIHGMAWCYKAEKQCNDRTSGALLKAHHLISPFLLRSHFWKPIPHKKNASGHTHSKAFFLITFGSPAIMSFRL